MKRLRSLPLVAAFALCPFAVFAQGSLLPAGAPAPTMKTLAQIEPRSALGTPGVATTSTITINASGSYVLMSDLVVAAGDGIAILANDVTVDLNGFTIRSTALPAQGYGIRGTDAAGVKITNGHIRSGATIANSVVTAGEGFQNGIGFDSNCTGAQINGITVDGANGNAIILLGSSVVRDCTIEVAKGYGILATVIENCVAKQTQNIAISGGTVSGCYGLSPANTGISATTATNCSGWSTSGYGLSAEVAMNCYGFTTSGTAGLRTFGTASFCRGYNGNAANAAITGLHAFGCTAANGTITSTNKDFCH